MTLFTFDPQEFRNKMTKTELILRDMCQPGKMSTIVGGQFGSESKGGCAGWLAYELLKVHNRFDFVTSMSAVQSGHTLVHKGVRRVSFHLPSSPWVSQIEGAAIPTVYLNGGSIIDAECLEEELKDFEGEVYIHPLAACVTQDCRDAENRPDSAQTRIASTRKGVGEALARKVTRSGLAAKDHPFLKQFVRRIDLNYEMHVNGASVLCEVPQGVSLSLNHSQFWPNCTSRDCTTIDAMSMAGVYPGYYGACTMVIRAFPIRVGNIVENGETVGRSGEVFPDQREMSWEELGQPKETTTVTKRTRRVFSFSRQQLRESFSICRPDAVFLTFTNYCRTQQELDAIETDIYQVSKELFMPPPHLIYEWGASTADVGESYEVPPATPRALPLSA